MAGLSLCVAAVSEGILSDTATSTFFQLLAKIINAIANPHIKMDERLRNGRLCDRSAIFASTSQFVEVSGLPYQLNK